MLAERVIEWTEEWKREGLEEGQIKERKRMARRLLAAGFSVPQVAELTSLSVEEVEELGEEGGEGDGPVAG